MRAKRKMSKSNMKTSTGLLSWAFIFETKTQNRRQWATTEDDSHEDRSSPSFFDNLSTAEENMRLNCLTIIRAKEIYETYYEDIIEASNNDNHMLHE